MDDTPTVNLQNLLAPLSEDEQSQAVWAEVQQELEALALTEEEYLEFLQTVGGLLKDLQSNHRQVQDELERLKARKILESN